MCRLLSEASTITNVAYRLTTADDAEAAGCDLVRRWLREFNWAANADFMEQVQRPECQARPLILLAEIDDRDVGGLIAETQFAWLRVSIMAVDPAFRSRGLGAALLAEAERVAADRGCRYSYVDTMEYQAPSFYLKQGYTVAGKIPDWDSRGHAKFHLIKPLAVES